MAAWKRAYEFYLSQERKLFMQQWPWCPKFIEEVLISFKVVVIIICLSFWGVQTCSVFEQVHQSCIGYEEIGFQCLALSVARALEKSAHLCCPCTSTRNICPATGCILQYKCHLGDIWGWLQGSLPGHEAKRNTSCLKQVLEAHTDTSVKGTEKGFSGTRKEGRRKHVEHVFRI